MRASRLWLLGLTFAFALGTVLGAATVSRGTVSGRDAAVLARLAEHLVIVDGPLNGVAGPHVIFEGVNVHIRSGSGSTDEGKAEDPSTVLTGLGNLVIGYNGSPVDFIDGERGGSHTLIIGDAHRYVSWGGFVAGAANILTAGAAGGSGGTFNLTSNVGASVSGGSANVASGPGASVSGGLANVASGTGTSISGGQSITAGNDACWQAGTFNHAC